MRKTGLLATCLALASLCPAAGVAEGTNTGPDVNLLQAQVILSRLGFSPGILDGRPGASFTSAIKGFQSSRGLQATGKLDDQTNQALQPYRGVQPTIRLKLSAQLLAGPFTNPIPKDEGEQAKLPALGYRTPIEKLAEMFHTTPQALAALNPPDTKLAAGSVVTFPNALPSSRAYDEKLPADWRATLNMLNVDATQPAGAKIVVDKSDQALRVYDSAGTLIAQFPATMGSTHDPLPIGNWKIQGASYNPKFHFNPALFWDAKAGDEQALLPAGPNGPVGVVWLDLSKPHYGIHGTPNPELIGRTESHGCIRLSNWDAARLSLMVKAGTPAVFQS